MDIAINPTAEAAPFADKADRLPGRKTPEIQPAPQGLDTVNLSSAGRSMRVKRPLSISLGAGFPNGIYLGIDYSLSDKWAVGGSIGTARTLMDYETHGRYYFGRLERFGAYAETGLSLVHTVPGTHFLESSTLKVGGVLSQSLGVEFRARNGVTFNASAGAGYAAGQDLRPTLVPVVKLGIGYSF